MSRNRINRRLRYRFRRLCSAVKRFGWDDRHPFYRDAVFFVVVVMPFLVLCLKVSEVGP